MHVGTLQLRDETNRPFRDLFYTVTMKSDRFETWLSVDGGGLYCRPGGFHIDPSGAVERAIITHGHSDHARSGHAYVLATKETLGVMELRLGSAARRGTQALTYGETLKIGDVTVKLVPAGHVLGSAQVVIDYKGARAVISGDYKRASDPTCAGFELVPCDLFVTEATFALPVFRHGNAKDEIAKLLKSRSLFPERTHVVGAYGLGKSQRVIALLRQAGYERPIYIHGALAGCCALYENFGVRARRAQAGDGSQAQRARGRNRVGTAKRDLRSLVAALRRSAHRVCLGLDARAGAWAATRRRAAAGDLRSRRLG